MGVETALAATIAKFTTIGTALKAASAIVAVAKFVAVAAASTLLAKRAQDFDPGISGRTITKRGTVEPQQKIYGEALVAGTLAFMNVSGDHNGHLWAVHVLAGHQVDSITDIWLDDQVIDSSIINGGAAAGGGVDSGKFGPIRGNDTVSVAKYLGTSSQTADSDLVSTFAGWTSDHRLRGYAYIVTQFVNYDKTEQLWEAGDPTNVRALVKGALVYDPRLDSTNGGSGSHRYNDSSTWEWSDNPALCVADYLMDAKFSPFPGGIDPTRINWASVTTAADACDTLVDVPPAASPANTEKRFTCNGALYGSANAEDNLEALLSSMNGDLVFSGGEYYIYAGVYEAPASGDDLSEDDIVGPIGIRSALDQGERVNTIKATYIDSEKLWEPTETAPISVSTYVDRDNGDTLETQIELPFTSSWYMAQRVCLKQLYAANQELTLTVPCNLKAARFAPGDRISVTITERGWSPKVFRVLDWNFFDRGEDQIGVNLELREDDSGAWADPAVGDYNTRSAAGTLTIADPVPIPSVDTIPRGIAYGEGAWSIQLTKNAGHTGAANDGEIRFQSGVFVLPDGTKRTLSNDAQVNTPYEGSTKPPDGIGYVVWGATNPVSRFAASPEYNFGDSNAEGAGLFAAIYDRTRDQWYAVDNGGNEVSFTPAATDYVVARFVKTSSSGGLDALTALVSRMAAQAGDTLLNEAGDALDDIDVRNDELVTQSLGSHNANPTFQIPRRAPNGDLAPASWFGFNSNSDAIQYESPSTRDVLFFPVDTAYRALNAAFLVNTSKTYEVAVLAKRASGDGAQLRISIHETTDNLDSGERAVYAFTHSGSEADPSSLVHTANTNEELLSSPSLTTSYAVYRYTYTPNASVKWASLLLAPASDGDPTVNAASVEWAVVAPN